MVMHSTCAVSALCYVKFSRGRRHPSRLLHILRILFTGHCARKIREIIPGPLRRVGTTRSSTHSHSFQVSLSTPRTLSHKSLIPRTCNLWNVLLTSSFPESYNLPSFKSKVNKLDLLSLSLSLSGLSQGLSLSS